MTGDIFDKEIISSLVHNALRLSTPFRIVDTVTVSLTWHSYLILGSHPKYLNAVKVMEYCRLRHESKMGPRSYLDIEDFTYLFAGCSSRAESPVQSLLQPRSR